MACMSADSKRCARRSPTRAIRCRRCSFAICRCSRGTSDATPLAPQPLAHALAAGRAALVQPGRGARGVTHRAPAAAQVPDRRAHAGVDPPRSGARAAQPRRCDRRAIARILPPLDPAADGYLVTSLPEAAARRARPDRGRDDRVRAAALHAALRRPDDRVRRVSGAAFGEHAIGDQAQGQEGRASVGRAARRAALHDARATRRIPRGRAAAWRSAPIRSG